MNICNENLNSLKIDTSLKTIFQSLGTIIRTIRTAAYAIEFNTFFFIKSMCLNIFFKKCVSSFKYHIKLCSHNLLLLFFFFFFVYQVRLCKNNLVIEFDHFGASVAIPCTRALAYGI
jgi:hypothetical protein